MAKKMKPRMKLEDLRTETYVTGLKAIKDLRKSCALTKRNNVRRGRNISIISNSLIPTVYRERHELADLCTYANELLEQGYAVVDQADKMFGEKGGLNKKMVVLGYNNSKNQFFIDKARVDESNDSLDTDQRHYILKKMPIHEVLTYEESFANANSELNCTEPIPYICMVRPTNKITI